MSQNKDNQVRILQPKASKLRLAYVFMFYSSMWDSFLRNFKKLRKATNRFVIPVWPSAWNNWVPTGRIFMKLMFEVFFKNMSRNLSLINILQEFRAV